MTPHQDSPFLGDVRFWAVAAPLFLALALVASCARVHVTVETTVGADGTVSRKVAFLRAKGPPLDEAYELPSEPDWTALRETLSVEGLTPEERAAVAPAPSALAAALVGASGEELAAGERTFVRYSVTRTYRPGEALEPDYVKPHPTAPGRSASNSIEVERSPGLLGTTVRYRETFTEASDPEKAAQFLRKASAEEVKRQVKAVEEAHPRAASWRAFEASELEAVEGKLSSMMAAWRSISDRESLAAAEEALGRYSDWMESMPERLSAAAGLELQEVEALLEDPGREQREEELSRALAKYLGAHIGEGDYSFTLIVHMPGSLVSTSAEEVRGFSTAVCRFGDEYFLMQPFSCEAESWTPTGF